MTAMPINNYGMIPPFMQRRRPKTYNEMNPYLQESPAPKPQPQFASILKPPKQPIYDRTNVAPPVMPMATAGPKPSGPEQGPAPKLYDQSKPTAPLTEGAMYSWQMDEMQKPKPNENWAGIDSGYNMNAKLKQGSDFREFGFNPESSPDYQNQIKSFLSKGAPSDDQLQSEFADYMKNTQAAGVQPEFADYNAFKSNITGKWNKSADEARSKLNQPPEALDSLNNPIANAAGWADTADERYQMVAPDPNKALAGANVYQQSLDPAFALIDQQNVDAQRALRNRFGGQMSGGLMSQILDSERRAGMGKSEAQRQSMETNIERGREDLNKLSALQEGRRGDWLQSAQRAGEFASGIVGHERDAERTKQENATNFERDKEKMALQQKYGLDSKQADAIMAENLMKQQAKAETMSSIFNPLITNVIDQVFPNQNKNNLLKKLIESGGENLDLASILKLLGDGG